MNNYTLFRTRPLLLIALLAALTVGGLAFGLRHGQAQSASPGETVVLTPASSVIEARVAVSSLNLRTGPHVSYTAVAYLMDGEQVTLVGRNRAATWAQVELYNGYRGWVNARYLRGAVNLAALPVADVALLGITAFVTNDPIAVYAGPNKLYPLVGTARPGDVLALNGRNDDATWVHIYLPDGRPGWVPADSPFLPSSAINDLPIITPFLDAPPPELAAFYLVYTGPSFLYEAVDVVAEGQTLGIRGRTADARWVLVRLENGREGWIAAEIIQIAVPLENVPIIEGIAPPQVVGWQAGSGAAAATTQPAEPTATATEAATLPPTYTPEPTATGDATAPATGDATAPATGDATPGGGKKPPIDLSPDDTPAATGEAAATATGDAAASATPPPSPTPRPTRTTAPTRADTATPPPTATATQPAATATATTPAGAGGVSTPTGLPVVFVYATPSDDAAPILRVVPGQSVVLIGRTADSEWIQIWLPGDQTGWIRASTVQVEIDLDVLPVVEP